ncbi:hypothetical protein SAMN05192559_107210 [Halobacillus karajensis]|uniref:DUF6241 domain-containing protein n=1 Tax=Halobacillus karajensis TaxID=195088 RepID=UPI0008A78581|nr:DUF6241 domain-containing protein [Halobacillus karajensis]SEI02510.1 hypothetical protein SAMN05192559_107210 [Halobacillus karajensis]
MSHQKVRAAEKWGFYEMTDERINWLRSAVQTNNDLMDAKLYKEILNKWSKRDFTTIDVDHNRWRLERGTVGKANGVLTPEEEKEFIEKNR